MKTTIRESVSKEIELPKYFKDGDRYYMAVDEIHIVRVTDKPFKSFYTPCIEYTQIDCVSITSVDHISETEFKNAFLRVSLAIEETLNN